MPYDRGLQDLVGELSTRSQEFRTRWAAHNVRQHQTGRKRLHHPVVGDLDVIPLVIPPGAVIPPSLIAPKAVEVPPGTR